MFILIVVILVFLHVYVFESFGKNLVKLLIW